jgi:hypothetical protein
MTNLDKTSDATTGDRRLARSGRQFGYLVAVAVNAALFYVVAHVAAWNWPQFLTEDFDRVDQLILISIGAAIVANLAYVAFDELVFKSFAEATLNVISLVATIRVYQVFPFDFTGYEFDWTWVARLVLILVLVATTISFLTQIVRGIRELFRTA